MQASIDHSRPVLDWHGVRTPREPATLEAFTAGLPGRAADMGDISPTWMSLPLDKGCLRFGAFWVGACTALGDIRADNLGELS